MRATAGLAGGMLAVALAAAPAAATPAVWQGDLFVTAVTSACTGVTGKNNFYTTVYRPDVAPPPLGQAKEALSIYTGRGAFLIEAPGATLRGSVVANSTAITRYATLVGGTGTAPVKLTITPATITATTPVVQISGTLGNFFNVSGCTAAVTAVLARQP